MSKKSGKNSDGSRRGKIIINAKKSTVTRIRLAGPTTLDEGRELAAELNGVIARFNTLYFKRPDGTEILPKITSKTEMDD